MTVLGIDPGIANTGLAVVSHDTGSYRLIASRLVCSSPRERQPERLLHIYNHVFGLLNEFAVDIAAVERVFHNRNVSSSISTATAIGAVGVAVGCHAVDMIELTPQFFEGVWANS